MYTHDPMQYARSTKRLYPAVYKTTKRDKILTLALIAIFIIASLIG